jgi:universal stress protein E
MQILAATDFSTRSSRALRQAGLLAQQGLTDLHVVHVVDDDKPEAWCDWEDARRNVCCLSKRKQCRNSRVRCHPAVVTGDPFDGILRTAAQLSAELLVMGAHRKQLLLDVLIGTTLERVIRSARVLVVNNPVPRSYESVMVAVDMSEASAAALRICVARGVVRSGAAILHAFLAVSKGRMLVDGNDPASIDRYTTDERQSAMNELASLAQDGLFFLDEGGPMEVISRAVAALRPDLLVMSTRGRSGLLRL